MAVQLFFSESFNSFNPFGWWAVSYGHAVKFLPSLVIHLSISINSHIMILGEGPSAEGFCLMPNLPMLQHNVYWSEEIPTQYCQIQKGPRHWSSNWQIHTTRRLRNTRDNFENILQTCFAYNNFEKNMWQLWKILAYIKFEDNTWQLQRMVCKFGCFGLATLTKINNIHCKARQWLDLGPKNKYYKWRKFLNK